MNPLIDQSIDAMYTEDGVQLAGQVDWPVGTRLIVTPVEMGDLKGSLEGQVIIVGFGLAGRCVADLLSSSNIQHTIVEKNPVTVETQRALGRKVVEGSATKLATLIEAGLNTASVLALTIPDEEAVLKAIAVARRLRPEIYIIARTNYSSKGMKASQLGADDVVKAEQAVALQFYDRLARRIRQAAQLDVT